MIDGVMGIAGSNTVSQMRQVMFQRLDTNGDGVIDKTEMMAAFEAGKKRPFASQKDSPTLDQAFAKIDTNNDGVISQGEFSALLSGSGAGGLFSGATSSLVNFLMSAGDNKGPGVASAEDRAVNGLLKSYLTQCSQLAKQQAAQHFMGTI